MLEVTTRQVPVLQVLLLLHTIMSKAIVMMDRVNSHFKSSSTTAVAVATIQDDDDDYHYRYYCHHSCHNCYYSTAVVDHDDDDDYYLPPPVLPHIGDHHKYLQYFKTTHDAGM